MEYSLRNQNTSSFTLWGTYQHWGTNHYARHYYWTGQGSWISRSNIWLEIEVPKPYRTCSKSGDNNCIGIGRDYKRKMRTQIQSPTMTISSSSCAQNRLCSSDIASPRGPPPSTNNILDQQTVISLTASHENYHTILQNYSNNRTMILLPI